MIKLTIRTIKSKKLKIIADLKVRIRKLNKENTNQHDEISKLQKDKVNLEKSNNRLNTKLEELQNRILKNIARALKLVRNNSLIIIEENARTQETVFKQFKLLPEHRYFLQ